MTRNFHEYKLQPHTLDHEEETQNFYNHKTSKGNKSKTNIPLYLFLPQQNDCSNFSLN